MLLFPSQKIYLDKSKIAGRGVFARVPIKKDEIIEVTPAIIIPYQELDLVNPDLSRYLFKWRINGQDSVAISMGYGSFYNHSTNPNAAHIQSIFERTITFFALHDIKKGEEITHNYGYEILPEMVKK